MARLAWKRLFKSDHNNMHGRSAPGGGGGGATYIVLGKSSPRYPWASFFPPMRRGKVTVPAVNGAFTVTSNPERRDGEWLIVDQRRSRHPAWTAAAGFPDPYPAADPPVVLIIRSSGAFRVAWLPQSDFAALAPPLAAKPKGVGTAPAALLARLGLEVKSALEEFALVAAAQPDAEFDPADIEDARKRVLAEVVRRQGQGPFRKKLVAAYQGRCAITGCSVRDVLEAAHISPYRGPDTNKADNGLLLRADIHSLFDLGLISINPDSLTVRVSRKIEDEEYRALDGKSLKPGKIAPSKAALQEHWSRSTP